MKYSIRSKGQFTTKTKYALQTLLLGLKELRKVRWIECTCLAYLIAIPLTIANDAFKPLDNTIHYALAEEVTPPVATSTATSTVVIELTYSKERVKELITEAFPDAPIMMKVAACESGFLQHAYNPTNNSHDGGVFQISQKYHGDRMETLGLDPYDVRDNITYARMLYDEQGLAPWSASKFCWQK
jgi:hypothetical protein